MNAFIVWLYLADGFPIVAVPVDSCEWGRQWLLRASSWAERSGIERGRGPMYVCEPLWPIRLAREGK